jgi:hypothetical protein
MWSLPFSSSTKILHAIISPLHATGTGTATLIVRDLIPETIFENMNSSLFSAQFSPYLCSPVLLQF